MSEAQKTFKLSKPLKIFRADKDVELMELPYDFENMTARDKLNATKEMRIAGYAPSVDTIDSTNHLFLFGAAVHKAETSFAVSDVLAMNAKDSERAARLAQYFFYGDLMEEALKTLS